MLAGSDYEWPHSLGVNLETGTSTPLPFFVLPTGRIKEGGKKAQGKKKKRTDKGNFSLTSFPDGRAITRSRLYISARVREGMLQLQALLQSRETGG